MDYSSEVRRRFISPLRVGAERQGTPGLVYGEAEDRVLNVWVRFEVETCQRSIRKVRFRVYGCPHTIAAASWVAEWLEGAPVGRLRELDVHALSMELAVPVEKLGKLLLIEDALVACARCLSREGLDGREADDGDITDTQRG